jgi:hypothetical protein
VRKEVKPREIVSWLWASGWRGLMKSESLKYMLIFGLLSGLLNGLLIGLYNGLVVGLLKGLTTAALLFEKKGARDGCSPVLKLLHRRLEMCSNLL